MPLKHLKDHVTTIKPRIDCRLQFKDCSVIVEPGDTFHDVPPIVKKKPDFLKLFVIYYVPIKKLFI